MDITPTVQNVKIKYLKVNAIYKIKIHVAEKTNTNLIDLIMIS